MLDGMRQTENPPQNLLHIHLTRLIGKGSQYVGKRTVPPLLQRIHRNNIANRAIRGQQILVFQLIDVSSTYGNLIGGNVCLDQFCSDFLKSRRILLSSGLSLK